MRNNKRRARELGEYVVKLLRSKRQEDAMSTVTAPRSSRSAGTQHKRLSLSEIQKAGQKLPSRVIVHGPPGSGKTSWAAYAPNALFLMSRGETGLVTLIDNEQLPQTNHLEVKSWDELIGVIDELTTTDHQHKTLVMDVLTGFERLAQEMVCNRDLKGDWSERGFEGFQRGYRMTASGPWKELLIALDRLREVKRMGIIGLCHSAVTKVPNPSGADFIKYAPSLFKDTWEITQGWADMILFFGRTIGVEKDKGDKHSKAVGASGGVIHTSYDPSFDAKHRHGLPEEIEMGTSGQQAWNNFATALATGRKQSEKGGAA